MSGAKPICRKTQSAVIYWHRSKWLAREVFEVQEGCGGISQYLQGNGAAGPCFQNNIPAHEANCVKTVPATKT
jgi:hypothetical protein